MKPQVERAVGWASLPDTTQEPDPAWLTLSTSTLSEGAQCFSETTTQSPDLLDQGVVLPHRLRMTRFKDNATLVNPDPYQLVLRPVV
jgi:hypothetical protein